MSTTRELLDLAARYAYSMQMADMVRAYGRDPVPELERLAAEFDAAFGRAVSEAVRDLPR